MKFVALISLLLSTTTAYSINELEQLTPVQAQAMSTCMEQYNDLHKCYKLSVSDTSNENCTEVFETGETVCQNENGTLRLKNEASSDNQKKSTNSSTSRKSPCSAAYFTASTQCNTQLTPSPQTNSLLASIQSAKNVGNIKEACAAAQNLNALSWNMNTTFGLQCLSAVRNCISSCSISSEEHDACENLETNVKLAQNQSIENAKSYAQSSECKQVASGCDNNSYDNPNCPQYCQKPGRQNDPLCTTQKSFAQERPLPINSKTTNTPNSQNIETGNLSAVSPEKYPEFNNSKNDFVTPDESTLGSNHANVDTPSNGSSRSYAGNSSSPTPTTLNQENSRENSNKPTATVGTTDNSNNGGGLAGTAYTPQYARGYPDAIEPKEDEKKWFDLTRFLPMSEEEKINRNMRIYNQKLLAQSQRTMNRKNHFINAKFNQNKNPEITVEQARMPTSEVDKKILPKSKILTIFNLLAALSLIYFFFIREKV